MIISPKLRILTYAARHNPLAALGQAGLFLAMVGAVLLIVSSTAFNLSHGTGIDHGSWVDLVTGIILVALFALAALGALFGIVESARFYLRLPAEQTQGFVYRGEDFDQRMREAANRRLNLPAEQLTLF